MVYDVFEDENSYDSRSFPGETVEEFGYISNVIPRGRGRLIITINSLVPEVDVHLRGRAARRFVRYMQAESESIDDPETLLQLQGRGVYLYKGPEDEPFLRIKPGSRPGDSRMDSRNKKE